MTRSSSRSTDNPACRPTPAIGPIAETNGWFANTCPGRRPRAQRIRAVADLDRALGRGTTFDLVDGETELLYPDSASFLAQAIREIPREWLQPAVRATVDRVATQSGANRQTAAAALADRLSARYANVVAYGAHHTSQVINPRIRCRVLTPAAYGLELAAQCLNDSPG